MANTNTIHIDGEHITVKKYGHDDYMIGFDVADYSVRGTMLDIVREFADWQYHVMAEPAVSFEHDDQEISNPWMDPSARFPLSSAEASDVYGLDNLLRFVMDACTLLRPSEEVRA